VISTSSISVANKSRSRAVTAASSPATISMVASRAAASSSAPSNSPAAVNIDT
jgi:hypothetical protein